MKSTVYESNPHTTQELKDNTSHAVAAIKITMLYRLYLNMVTARLLTNCSNTLRNIHTNARENITRTRAKRKVGHFFVANSVLSQRHIWKPPNKNGCFSFHYKNNHLQQVCCSLISQCTERVASN